MSDCLFCKIISGELPSDLLYEDDKIIVIKDIFPSSPVHLLMIPKKHYDSLKDFTQEDESLLGYMMLKVSEIAENNGLSHGFKTQINTGKAGGQEIFHLHIHIMGRLV